MSRTHEIAVTQKNFRGACSRTLLAIMGARRNFRGGRGWANPKKGPHHEVKSSKKAPHGEKVPKNEKNVAERPPYMKNK